MNSPAKDDPDTAQALQRLVDEVEHQRSRRWHTAAQLAVNYRGRTILDYVTSDPHRGCNPALTTRSPFLVFSIGKSLLALCIHHLAETGLIHLDCPIAEYWPEFSRYGKDRITFRHALLHQAGIPKHGLLRHLLAGGGAHSRIRLVAKARPIHNPGTVSAYHPLNYGYMLGEALQRVSGMSPQAYLKLHFLDPMQLSVTSWEPDQTQLDATPKVFAAHVDQWPAAWIFNRLRRRSIHNPGFNLYSNAHELCTLFQMLVNGGLHRGRWLLRKQTVQAAVKLRYRGIDETIGRQTLWAEGFHLGGRKPEHDLRPGPAMGSRSSVNTFGHCGHMSSIVWADPEYNLVMAFTCNGLLNSKGAANRWQRLSDLVWDLVKPETP